MARKGKEGFANFVGRILQNSMLTGIPQIASAANWPKRIVRTLVFIACMAGFIYQSLSFMWIYWRYEVIVDVQVENPTYVERPSVTVCTKMGFKSKEFCDDPEGDSIRKEFRQTTCVKVENGDKFDDWCECIPRMCDKFGNLKNLTYLKNYRDLVTMPRKDIQKWILTPKEIVGYCMDVKMRKGMMTDCLEKEYLQIPCPFLEDQPESCFTMNSLIGRPNGTVDMVFTDSEIQLFLNQHEDIYPTNMKEPSMAISIHNPYTILNPFTNGFMLEQAYEYVFRLKKVVKKLLPYPYKTDCIDYRAMWEARGRRGPTNLRECILECQRNISMAKHGCILMEVYMPTDDLRCTDFVEDEDLYVEARQCAEAKCRPACFEEYYTIEMDSGKSNFVNCRKSTRLTQRKNSFVQIKLDGMETTTYTYSPKFQVIETFSYLGGYVGMWLGISLVAVFDFLETVYAMMKYPLRRFANFRARRKKINQVRQLQKQTGYF